MELNRTQLLVHDDEALERFRQPEHGRQRGPHPGLHLDDLLGWALIPN